MTRKRKRDSDPNVEVPKKRTKTDKSEVVEKPAAEGENKPVGELAPAPAAASTSAEGGEEKKKRRKRRTKEEMERDRLLELEEKKKKKEERLKEKERRMQRKKEKKAEEKRTTKKTAAIIKQSLATNTTTTTTTTTPVVEGTTSTEAPGSVAPASIPIPSVASSLIGSGRGKRTVTPNKKYMELITRKFFFRFFADVV